MLTYAFLLSNEKVCLQFVGSVLWALPVCRFSYITVPYALALLQACSADGMQGGHTNVVHVAHDAGLEGVGIHAERIEFFYSRFCRTCTVGLLMPPCNLSVDMVSNSLSGFLATCHMCNSKRMYQLHYE
jgi:hypothetical protein